MTDKAIIKLEGLTKSYRLSNKLEVPVLKGIDLSINRGEFVALMGQSGSGKSTLLNIIGFLHAADQGQYHLNGEDISQFKEDKYLSFIRNRKIGFVFQQYYLIPRLTALENVILPTMYAQHDKEKRKQRAIEILTKVGLGDKLGNKPSELSGGQQQRVAIARALINDPELILADEPTGALDSHTGEEIMGILRDFHKQGATIVMVTHEPKIAHHADRVIYLEDGKVMHSDYDLNISQ